jgi:cytochrome c556
MGARSSLLLAAAAVAAGLAGTLAADPSPKDVGWTGLSNAKDLIAARQELMMEMERLMQPIDSSTIESGPVDAAGLTSAAQTIATMLAVVPHLFPPTTNLYDPKAEEPATLALPAIWKNFGSFYAFAGAASRSAASMAELTKPDELRAAAKNLRGTCDACHTPFLRPYVPSTVSDSDKDFDFDSVLGGKKDK